MDVPSGLGERGLALWEALSTGSPPVDALALEAARTADRLDELDSIIQGKGVLNLMQFRLDFPSEEGEPFTVEVKFNAVLAEARQQGAALAGLLTKLVPADSKPASKAPANLPSNVSPLDKLRDKMKA